MSIDKQKEAAILRYHFVEHWGVHTIASQLGVHHSTVDRVLCAAGLPKVERMVKPSKLDPYLPLIAQTLEAYPTLSAVRILEMARLRGYQGGDSHFRARVAQMRPRKQPEAYLRLSTLPAEQAQMDWGHFGHVQIGRARRPLMAFVLVLSWSRRVFLRFYLHARTDSFIRGHVDAFSDWGGVPRIILFDNLKSAVIERDAQAIRFNPQLLELAAHYHFEPRPVAVARGNEKGRVERAIRYIRDNFFAARHWSDLDDLNAQAQAWCEGVSSDRRCPEDTTLTVRDAFVQEQPQLLGLPDNPFPCEQRCEVSIPKTPYARFDLNDYSVPHTYVRRTVSVLASLDTVRVLDGMQELATHPRSWDKAQQVENEEHVRALVQQKKSAREHRSYNRLHQAAPSSRTLLEQAAMKGAPMSTLVRDLNRLLDEYGAAELQASCIEALKLNATHSNTVRLILQRRREEQNLPPALAVPLPADERTRNITVRTASLERYNRFHVSADSPNSNTNDDDNNTTIKPENNDELT